MADEGTGPKGDSPAGKPSRQPYEAPAIAWEEALEDRPNLIEACAQVTGVDAACDASPFS